MDKAAAVDAVAEKAAAVIAAAEEAAALDAAASTEAEAEALEAGWEAEAPSPGLYRSPDLRARSAISHASGPELRGSCATSAADVRSPARAPAGDVRSPGEVRSPARSPAGAARSPASSVVRSYLSGRRPSLDLLFDDEPQPGEG